MQKQKKLGKRLLSVVLALVLVASTMVVGVVTTSAAQVDSDSVGKSSITPGTVIYLDATEKPSEWTYANMYVYLYGGTSGETWVPMTSAADGVYQFTVPDGNYKNIIFVNKDSHDASNVWPNDKEQTSDITDWTDAYNCFKLDSVKPDGKWVGGTWTNYNPVNTVGNYTVTLSSSDTMGTLTTSTDSGKDSGTADEGDEVTLTVTPKNGNYTVESLTAVDSDKNTVTITDNKFTMPAGNVTVTATYRYNKESFKTGSVLWVDTQESVTDTPIALVKWTNRKGAGSDTLSNNNYILYLPGGMKIAQTPVYYGFSSLTIDGVAINQGDKVAFEDGASYTVVGDSTTYTLTVYQSDSASIYISTAEDMQVGTKSGVSNDAQASAFKETTKQKNGQFMSAGENGKIIDKPQVLAQIKGRGNSSWSSSCRLYGKYAYNMKLDKKADVLKMGANKAKSFCLLANNMDESLLRNYTTYDAALKAELGYVPHYKVADMYNNGEYLGSYLVTEKVDVGSSKLVLGETVEDYHDEDSITYANTDTTVATGTYKGCEYRCASNISYNADAGANFDVSKKSYLIEFDLMERAKAEMSWFKTPEGQYIAFKAPEEINVAEMQFVIDKWIAAEAAVYGGDYETMNELMDLDSFADVYLVQEFTKNLDSCATSYYVYYDGTQSNPKWQATPIWDYDWALGGVNSNSKQIIANGDTDADNNLAVSSGWFAKYKKLVQNDATVLNKWNLQAQLANNSTFWNTNVIKQWNSDFYNSLVAEYGTIGNADGVIDQAYAAHQKSFAMNETRYGFVAANLTSGWGSTDTGATPQAAYTWLKNWAIARREWMNGKLAVDINSVTLAASAVNIPTGRELVLTATPDPDYIPAAYTFYVSSTNDFNEATQIGTSDDGTFTVTVNDEGTFYYFVTASFTGKTANTVTSEAVEVTQFVPAKNHNVTIYFKAPTADAYKLNATFNGSAVTFVKDYQIGKTYLGTLTMYMYKAELTGINSTQDNTLVIKTKRTNLNATMVSDFGNDEYWLAVDNMENGTEIVDLTGQPEYIRNYYHSALHMVYTAVDATDKLGYTKIGDNTYKMGTYLEQNPQTGAVVQRNTIVAATLAQKITADLTTADDVQTALLDVNHDGEINILDATLIQKSLVQG